MDMTDEFNEAEYISGFNKGYLLAKEFPEIADILNSATSSSDKLDGMKDGRQQYLDETLEKGINLSMESKSEENEIYRPSWLSNDRLNDEEISKDNSKDKDIDLDRE
jgi:hypothetical protein